MKKISLIVLVALFLVACGSTDSTNNSSEETEKTVEKDEATTTENNEETEQKEEVVKEEPKIEAINLDETKLIEDFAEITVKSNKFGKVINPPNPGSFYSYYENKEVDQIYLDTIISVKSLLTSGKSSDEFADVKIIYDNKYEYNTFSVIEENGGADFTYTNITGIEPLQTGVLHYLASVPTEIENDGKPLKAIITINGEEYEQVIR